MVPTRSVCVLLVLLCAAWLSAARLHPGAAVNDVSAVKASAAAVTSATDSIKMNSQAAIDGNSKKLISGKQIVRKCGNQNASYNVECERSLRNHLSDKADDGFVAFSADYHSPRHHPPKNNK